MIVYYKSAKTKDFFMKNNLLPKARDLSRTNLVYDFKCKIDECEHLPQIVTRYSGLPTCTLSRRLTMHLQHGAIKDHALQKHKRKITRKEIEEMTKILYFERKTIRNFRSSYHKI